MTSSATSHPPTIKDKPSAVRHFLDRPRGSPSAHLTRSISSSASSTSSSATSTLSSRPVQQRQRKTAIEAILSPEIANTNKGLLSHNHGVNRSSSMRGPAAPAVELNAASLGHARRLLRQLLQDLPSQNPAMVEKWEHALMPILLQATDDLDPDIRAGDEIDVRNFVKIKRVPGATPDDTVYLSGVVFTKNLALKSMPREISSPRVMLLAFPLEYHREEQAEIGKATKVISTLTSFTTAATNESVSVNGSVGADANRQFSSDIGQQHFISLEPVLFQEKEYLQKLVNAIALRQPQVLLTERGVSGYALQLLEKKQIAVAYNVNPNVIRAVARCTQADIITTPESLLSEVVDPLVPRVGSCEHFEIKTYVLDGRRKKTFIFMSGCPAPLACTIVLRGGDMDTLKKIKVITKFMAHVVYNLKLETCLMRDEFVFMPAPEASSMYHSMKVKNRFSQSSIKAIDGNESDKENAEGSGYYDSLVAMHGSKILSTSPFVRIPQPYLLWKARQVERRLQLLIKAATAFDEEGEDDENDERELVEVLEKDLNKTVSASGRLPEESVVGTKTISRVESVADEAAYEVIKSDILSQLPGGGRRTVRQIRRAILELEHDKLEYVSTIQKRQWEAYLLQTTKYLFNPFEYQHITILYSLICEVTTAPCTGPELVSIDYYRDGDCTLGQFIEGICESVDQQCSDGCSYTLAQHYRSYVHGHGCVNVHVEKLPSRIPGMENTILMWSHCNVCDTTLPALPMSENTWKYSFGKYLELSFWSTHLSLRAEVCPHDIHKDHVRIFGLRGLCVKFEYRNIELLDIAFPRTKLLWKPQIDVRLRAAEYTSIEERITKFFDSVIARLDSVRVDEFSSLDRTEDCRARVELLRERASREVQDLKGMLEDIYLGSSYREYLPLNAVIRSLQERVVQWDIEFADFDRSFYPSEKDIARLTAMQLKKMFLERDTSAVTLVPEDQTELTPTTDLSSAVELMPVLSERGDGRSVDSTPLPSANSTTAEQVEYSARSPDYAPSAFPSPGLMSVTKQDPYALNPNASKRGSVSKGLLKQPALDTDTKEVPTVNLVPPTPVSDPKEQDIPDSGNSDRSRTTSVDDDALSDASTLESVSTSNTESESTVSVTDAVTVSNMSSRPSRRKYPPERIVVPPPPFRHRFAQGTTRELARQLQLSRTGSSSDTTVTEAGESPEIPRSTPGQTKVISLARHFDQLSREFEKERARERKKLAAGRLRAVGTARPIVEVYRTIEDAVVEEEEEEFEDSGPDGGMSDEDVLSDSGTLGRKAKGRRRRRSVDSKLRKRDKASLSNRPGTSSTAENGTPSARGLGHSSHPSLDNLESETSSVLSPSDTLMKATEAPSYFAIDKAVSEAMESSINDAAKATSQTSSAKVEGWTKQSDEPASSQEQDSTGHDQLAERAQSSAQAHQPANAVSHADHTFHQELTPGPEKISLMTMLSNFWADRSASGWQPLDYPLQPSEHIFMDSDVIVREDEPSSLIAFCLSSSDYLEKLHQIRKADAQAYDDLSSSDDEVKPVSSPSQPNTQFYARYKSESDPGTPTSSNATGTTKSREELRKWLLKETGTHLKYQFQEGHAKLSCKIFYAELFDAFRTLCGCEESYIQSLSRCVKWDSTGGKSGSAFLKTLDDRLVVKQLSPSELDAFIKFAPSYFQYMAQVFFHDLPSVIAKIMGFYQVQVRNPVTNKSMKMDIIVMENLFYDRKLTRIFDLKGSMRNRHVEQTGRANEVLLDENMVEYIFESPLFVREHAKKILRASLWNDTLFLAKMNVMDYSLVIAIDSERQQLVVGIIDCLRTFTWDKKLESWVKERGLVGGGGKVPTVVTPRQYKNRFREAMERYILMVPDFWHQQ